MIILKMEQLPNLLENPTIYIFNENIVPSGDGSIKGLHTRIAADFLLHKGNIHLFLKFVDGIYVPVSIVYNKTNTYVDKQKKIDIFNDKSTFKCLRPIDKIELVSVI